MKPSLASDESQNFLHPIIKYPIITAEDSLAHFKSRREDDIQVRSQKRYLKYFERLMTNYQGKPIEKLESPSGPYLEIISFRVIGLRSIVVDFGNPTYKVYDGIMNGRKMSPALYPLHNLKNSSECHPCKYAYIDYCDFIPEHPIGVQNDVKVSWYVQGEVEALFGFWFHTYFEIGEIPDKNDIPEKVRIQEKQEISKEDQIYVFSFKYADVDGIRHSKKKKRFMNSFPEYFECRTYFKYKPSMAIVAAAAVAVEAAKAAKIAITVANTTVSTTAAAAANVTVPISNIETKN